ncbi:MAG: ORF6N domain-containing protein [Chitinophagaceae bacterium]|nr:ORF6N domain-containing protein [Chitinophagaceae bacterium]
MTKKSKSIAFLEEAVINKIYYIRKQKVMLDRDLAELYGVRAIRLREQVKRNIERFPGHFMFRLTAKEVEMMVSQNAIPSLKHLGGALPYAFTEHGVLMLANVLKSERAIEVSLRLIEIFVKLREMMLTHKDILLKLEQMERKIASHDENIQMIFEALKQLLNPPREPRPRIGYRRSDEHE